MAYIVGFPLLILLAIVQSTFLGNFSFLDGRPDLLLLAVVGWGLAGGKTEAQVWGLWAGFLIDLLSGLPFGTSSIALVSVGYLVTLFEGRVWEANLLMPLGRRACSLPRIPRLEHHRLSYSWAGRSS